MIWKFDDVLMEERKTRFTILTKKHLVNKVFFCLSAVVTRMNVCCVGHWIVRIIN